MKIVMARRTPRAVVCSALAVAFTAAGCGSSSPGTTTASSTAPAATTTSARPPRPHLHVRSPRSGAHTGQTVTVDVVLSGAASRRASVLLYILDGRRARRGSGHLTFRGLAPGRHHLLITLPNDRSVRGRTVFLVRTPPAAPSPAPVQTTQTQPPPTPAPAPPPATTTTSVPPPPPAPTGGIPQGPTAGDRDSDNSGGPSDGDGNI